MHSKQVLLSAVFILFVIGWRAPVWAQDIPTNYIQNPNMEHELNAIFWYGSWDPIYGTNGVVSHASEYMSNEDAHSGNWSMNLIPGAWVWVSYPIRGHEEKTFKASFWYKGYMTGYWNFVYRDVGLTEQDIPPALVQYIGADTCYHEFGGQDALKFEFGGDDGYTEDWTYFEFVWDFPGTLPGWGNTSMWYGTNDPAYIDDLYYGEWYEGQYSGEEPFGFINGDFEKTELNGEWLFNLAPWDAFGPNDFLSSVENHTDAGLQSLGLMDYMMVSEEDDTSSQDRNVTYYLPALGAEGEDMELNFWYKGNAATLDLRFYGNYGVTPDDFPLPDGSILVEDVANTVYDISTVLKFDDESTIPVKSLGSQNFDNPAELKMPGSSWLWSGSDYYTWDDWTTGVTDTEQHSGTSSFWLPGDPNWTGAEGTFDGIVDDTTYVISFWYKGKGQFELYLGSSLKYDLVNDPDSIVPESATADKDKINWLLDAETWTQFTFIYDQGSWLADSAVTAPASLKYDFVGTWDAADVAYIDDVFAGIIDEFGKPEGTPFVLSPDTLSVTVPPLAARWELPAVEEWTEMTINWTNPATDIGGNLTMFVNNDLVETPDYITPEKADFDPENAGWTYFDDFVYQIVEAPSDINKITQKALHLYPNPAVDVMYLSIEDPLSRIDIYNSLGQLVKSINNPDRKFYVSDLTSGMYMLNVTDQRGTVYKSKFIKE
ncbi:MAG TPA: T9SS type A sorting domain-containing protein [Bacteroidales bacterium]|nr:T9SS type A sorting domain-containing protein [Bacteroidales bacterium]